MNIRSGVRGLVKSRGFLQAVWVVLGMAFLTASSLPAKAYDREDQRPLSEVYSIIEDFVREKYLSNWSSSPRLIRRRYADPMDYYWGKKNVPMKQVLRDKLRYMSRWPQRYFRLVEDTLEVTRSEDDPYLYAVKFRYEFETKRRGEQRAGIGQTGLLLEVLGRRILIRGEGGKVLERY